MNELDIFTEALERTYPVDRAVFLDRACEGKPELRQRIEFLLKSQGRGSNPLDHPAAAGFAPTLDVPSQGNTATFSSEQDSPTASYPGKDEHVGATLGRKYKLIETIGEGGMGSVYMAQQTEPVKRAVAVKVIKAGMDSKAVLARFEAERQALAMMDHPNIARVLDAGTTESGRPYFVMELVKGVPITQFCDERKLTPRQRLELFVPVCNAIQHAHQKGVIHRDIKPNNVLVALYDDRPVPKVIDFGVAKAAGQTLTDKTLMTGFGAVVGTPEYMSPEQANLNNLDIDTRSDVYSLGVLLYELLTGTTPVDRKSLGKAALLEILRIVREVEAPRPSAKLSTIDTLPSVAANRGTEPAKLSKLMKGELDWVLLKALEKDRTRRYESANGLARDIQRYLADEVVEARPPSAGYRVRKFVKRHKGQVIAASLVLLALVAGFAGTLIGLVQADVAWREEANQRRIAEENETAAKKSELDAVRASERAKASEVRARIALGSADKMLDFPSVIRRGQDNTSQPAEVEYLAELAGQLEAQAKTGRGADEAEAYARLALVQFRQGKIAEMERSYESAIALLTTLCQSDPENAPEHWIQLAKTRGKMAKKFLLPSDPASLKKCEAIMRQADANWIRACELNPKSSEVFASRAAALDDLHGNVIPGTYQPYTSENRSRYEVARLPFIQAAKECWTKAIELRPEDQGLWLKLLRLIGDSNTTPEAFRTALRAAVQFPERELTRRYQLRLEEDYPYSREQTTFDSDLCLRLISAQGTQDAFRRDIAEPLRNILKEFPNYKYAKGIEFLLVLREAKLVESPRWIQQKPDEKPPPRSPDQLRRAAELFRQAIELARKPETKLPVEFLTLSLRDKGAIINEYTPKQKTTPISVEEYVWFHRLAGIDSPAEDVLTELQNQLTTRNDWRPSPWFLHCFLNATLPNDLLYNADTPKMKLIPLWTQADAMFSRIQAGIPRDTDDYRKVAQRFSFVALNFGNRFHNWGDLPRSKAAYTRCIQLLEEYAPRPGEDDSRYRARCYFDRGNLNLDRGDWTAALADYQKALVLSKKKPGDFDNMSVPGLEAISHFRSGTALLRLNRFDEAEIAFDESLRLRREEKFQSRPLKSGKQSVPWIVAVTEHDRAKEYRLIDRWEPALKWAKLALKTLDENEEVYPLEQVVRLRYSLHSIAAHASVNLKDSENAIQQWDSAKKYASAELLRLFAVESAAAYARAGRHAEAIQRLDDLASSGKLTALELYSLGCGYSSCSVGTKVEKEQATKYQDRAVAMLRKSSDAGMRDYDLAINDSDLNPLRDREDFKKWLEDIRPKSPVAIRPEQAAASIGKLVELDMVVRSVGFSKGEEWMYLNSSENYKDPGNVTVAIKNPTADLRKAMKLDADKEKLVGLRVRATGKIGLYRDAPQLVVESAKQLTIVTQQTMFPVK